MERRVDFALNFFLFFFTPCGRNNVECVRVLECVFSCFLSFSFLFFLLFPPGNLVDGAENAQDTTPLPWGKACQAHLLRVLAMPSTVMLLLDWDRGHFFFILARIRFLFSCADSHRINTAVWHRGIHLVHYVYNGSKIFGSRVWFIDDIPL